MIVEIIIKRDNGAVVVKMVGDAFNPMEWQTDPGVALREGVRKMTGFRYLPAADYVKVCEQPGGLSNGR